MTISAGAGKAFRPTVSVVNHDVPSDPIERRALALAQADRAIEGARLKIERQKQHLATAVKGKQERQRAHLKGAQEALAQAIAAKESI